MLFRSQWGCGFGSDTHGIYDEYMEVLDGNWNSILKVEGGYIDANSIDDSDIIDFSGIAND